MKTEYILMHKNIICAYIILDEYDGTLKNMVPIAEDHLPYLGTADIGKMKRWWQNRAIPGNRENLKQLLQNAGCENPQEYLAENLALSITDTYWVCPADLDLSWEQVKIQGDGDEDKFVSIHNETTYDRNASLGGMMSKYWDVSRKPAVMVKKAGLYQGQQAVNEEFGTWIHERQQMDIPYVKYRTEQTEDGDFISKCDAFTSETKEFVSAYEILNARKKANNVSLYDEYISIAAENGMEKDQMQRFMDYQTLFDFMISNSDRHLMNFGVLRDPVTLRFLAPAPIFDSGNSMFFEEGRRIYTRADILERKITAMHEREEMMLKHVKNKKLLRIEKLPSRDEVEEFYMRHSISKEKSHVIAQNYEVKCELLQDFQEGKNISSYLEKK